MRNGDDLTLLLLGIFGAVTVSGVVFTVMSYMTVMESLRWVMIIVSGCALVISIGVVLCASARPPASEMVDA